MFRKKEWPSQPATTVRFVVEVCYRTCSQWLFEIQDGGHCFCNVFVSCYASRTSRHAFLHPVLSFIHIVFLLVFVGIFEQRTPIALHCTPDKAMRSTALAVILSQEDV